MAAATRRITGTALCLAGLCVGCTGPEGPGLSRGNTYHIGIHPNDATVGDVDGDGHEDVILPSFLTAHVAVLRAAPDGPIYEHSAPLVDGATGATAADLDGDGRVELIAVDEGESVVHVLSYSGGQWTTVARHSVPGARYVTSGDIDGDGHIDVLATRFRDSDLWVAHGDGTGQLLRQSFFDLGPGPQLPVLYRDTTLGQPLRLATVTVGDDRIWIHDPRSNFEVVASAATPSWPTWVTPAELDGDPGVELIGAGTLADEVFVATGDSGNLSTEFFAAGAGAFATLAITGEDGATSHMFLTNKSDDTLSLYDNTPSGLVLRDTLDTDAGPSPMVACDLDLDGIQDVVVINAFADSATVFYGRR